MTVRKEPEAIAEKMEPANTKIAMNQMIIHNPKNSISVAATMLQMVLLAVVLLATNPLTAAPVRQLPKKVLQPDGQEITIVQQGDEWCHWVTDLEGRLRIKDDKGYYQTASEFQIAEWKEMQELGRKRQQTYFSHKKSRAAFLPQTRAVGEEWDFSSQNHLCDMPTKGKLNEIVILVEFPDCQFSDSIDQNSYYQDFLMKKGFDDLNSNGSVHDYFYENSMGVFDPQFEVFGPVMMSRPLTYYGENNKGQNDKHPQEMVIEACNLIDDKVDFCKFDNNNDGYIDVVHIIYAGEGENSYPTEHPEYIWPHAWSITSAIHQDIYFDGRQLDDYVCTCEIFDNQKDGIGTFCHEFSHALGLPDVYNSQGGATVGGEYDVMDSGLYLGGSTTGASKEGRCPCAMSAYERYELGWLTPELLIGNKYNGVVYSHKDTIPIDDHLSNIVTVYDTVPYFAQDTLPCLTSSNQALVLPVKSETNDPRDGEYFLFENRQMTGWDTYIPAHGMLVWHIDYQESAWRNNQVNTSHTTHPNIQLLRARPTSPFSGAPFPGGPRINNQLTATSTPALLGWDDRGTGSGMNQQLNNAALTDIEEKTIKSWPTDEMVIIFSFTDDGPDHVTSIVRIHSDETEEKVSQNDGQAQRVWRNGQLLIVTTSGVFDLQGRRIE